MGRLSILHILKADAQEIDLFTGRIDARKCAQLFEHWIDVSRVDTAFICGPEPMMLSISEALKSHGLRADQIKFELFASGQPGRAKRQTAAVVGIPGTQTTQAAITLDGTQRRFEMRRDIPILQAALDNDIDVPFACRAGVCSTCRAKVLQGEVEMLTNHALEDYEVAQGYVLTCQCYPISDHVVVDYDH
jgi:ring-1,2-phenylacetyl-CoA epoxidase subunit PaaE